MLSLIFQKLMRFPNSFASVQEVTWVQFCPKQLVSISSRRIDLIRRPRNFHLSVPSPKPKIAMHLPRKWKRSKESVCKWTKNKAGPFKTSKMTISDSFPINKSHQGPSQRLPTQTLRTLGYFDPLRLGQLVPIHRSTMHCVNQNGLRTLPNIKTDHSRQLSLQPKPSGSLQGASDQVSENLRFCHF